MSDFYSVLFGLLLSHFSSESVFFVSGCFVSGLFVSGCVVSGRFGSVLFVSVCAISGHFVSVFLSAFSSRALFTLTPTESSLSFT